MGADLDPQADSADEATRQETADPFPDETMATEKAVPDKPSGAVSLRGGACDVCPGTRHRAYPTASARRRADCSARARMRIVMLSGASRPEDRAVIIDAWMQH
jgi:hypothetical protein